MLFLCRPPRMCRQMGNALFYDNKYKKELKERNPPNANFMGGEEKQNTKAHSDFSAVWNNTNENQTHFKPISINPVQGKEVQKKIWKKRVRLKQYCTCQQTRISRCFRFLAQWFATMLNLTLLKKSQHFARKCNNRHDCFDVWLCDIL